MIISDLNYLEVADASVEGGFITSASGTIQIGFGTYNGFGLGITSPTLGVGNFASGGADGEAFNYTNQQANSFTKADTQSVVYLGGSSGSFSSSVAAIQPVSTSSGGHH